MGKIKKVLIFGANGLLGREFISYFKNNKLFKAVAVDRDQVDITNFDQVVKAVKKYRPDIVINCAALIDVDYCENNPVEAWLVNGLGAGNITRALNESNFFRTILVQLSTSDVFGNNYKQRFRESDQPEPVNAYGRSKLAGEQMVASEAKASKLKYFIIRTSWLYSEYKNTFIDRVAADLKSKKTCFIISDQYNIITWAKDLVQACGVLMGASREYPSGIYHLTNQSKAKLSKYAIALKIADKLKLDKKYCRPGLKKKILKAPRPDSAILENNRLIVLPDWQVSLNKYLIAKYGNK